MTPNYQLLAANIPPPTTSTGTQIDWIPPNPLDACIYKGSVVTLDCVPIFFERFIFAALILAGTIAVIIIIVSGIKFLLSGGDAKKVEGARKSLTYAIIGLILILSASFIVSLIGQITGVTCLDSF